MLDTMKYLKFLKSIFNIYIFMKKNFFLNTT